VRKWRRSRGTTETPQVADAQRAQQTAQVRNTTCSTSSFCSH
jgi:hypothetical protein